MNHLSTRKRLLAAQADLHRQLIGHECARWQAGSILRGHRRWWLVGGAVLAGVLLVRNGRQLIPWLPTVATLWRMLK